VKCIKVRSRRSGVLAQRWGVGRDRKVASSILGQGAAAQRLWGTCSHSCRQSLSTDRVAKPRKANLHRHARHDKTVLSVSCLAWRCELDHCSERVQTSNFLSATVLSCRESNSHRRRGCDTDRTVLSCLAWRCELAFYLFVGRA